MIRRRLTFVIIICGLTTPIFADSVSLTESVNDARVFEVEGTVDISGTLETPVGQGKSQSLPLKAKGTIHFKERRLPGSGRDAESLRMFREYLPDLGSEIEVRNQIASLRLRPARRLIIAQGRREGTEYFTPLGSLLYNELELLQFPGESLCCIGMLPLNPVEAGETWHPESWVVQMLTGIDAVLKSELTCTLIKVESGLATISYTGLVEGADDGAEGTMVINGEFDYDLKQHHIARFKQEQSETRSIGAVSPGLKVKATTTWTRKPTSEIGNLTDDQTDRIPLDPEPEWLLLSMESPWNIRFEYDRNWHLFHETDKAAVFRLVEEGSVVAQFNITNIDDASPGEHTSEEIFQADIRESLGSRLQEITKAEQLKTDDNRFLYRVTAVGAAKTKNDEGEEKTINMTWFYYLCAAPNGEQVAFVFSVETSVVEQLANRDLGIVQSLKFTKPGKEPEIAK
ncbi:MAG: hypothetical protein O2955_13440 [Planctomycetota bacterium]|nr:hypothetical protein [Planctomycetota bacterium]MDA1213514.1 hypothetical protein [Planctomycetota bacterium]